MTGVKEDPLPPAIHTWRNPILAWQLPQISPSTLVICGTPNPPTPHRLVSSLLTLPPSQPQFPLLEPKVDQSSKIMYCQD